MDNEQQIEEIRKYHQHLANEGKEVDENNAALMWIRRNAKKWRHTHGFETGDIGSQIPN